MSGMPEWMADLIEKGTNVKECLEMWRQEQESKRELERERWAQEREERQAQRESAKLEVERDVKLRELAIRKKELEHAKIGGLNPMRLNAHLLSYLSLRRDRTLMSFYGRLKR
ncbi:uncharacterized protein LOC134275156 [Saccostrea cucullata]|uniref:uncharacterized protein LOC134275156 n=1 Tax=Saccostrea cuccullata TaxID=36930 RepID=UPI002ED19344